MTSVRVQIPKTKTNNHENTKFRKHENKINFITPATKYIKVVIPAKAGIQTGTGCPRIKSGAGLSSPA